MSGPAPDLPARLRRTMELVYGVEGVAGARIWQWGDTIAVGVRVGPNISAADVLRRVEVAVSGVREPGEAWEFGVIEG